MRLAASVLLAGALALGCGDSTGPTAQAVAGTYVASGSTPATRRGSLTTTGAGGTVDWLAQGAAINLTLNGSGTTAGHIHLPDTGNGAVDADLTGTWTLDGSTVHLTQTADTFLRDIPLQVKGTSLVGDQTFAGTRVQVTLERAPTID